MTKGGIELLKQGAAELGVSLDGEMISRFCLLFDELQKWNKKINLTAVRDESDIIIKHFLDSLTLAKHLPPAGKMLDIGSGGGFPALPLQIVLPHLQIFSVDAVEKKILFQRHVARVLNTPTFIAVHARAENLANSYAQSFDIVVTRAFSELEFFGRLAAPLVSDSGTIIAMKGPHGSEETVKARIGLAEIGIEIIEEIPILLPLRGDRRLLVVMKKRMPL